MLASLVWVACTKDELQLRWLATCRLRLASSVANSGSGTDLFHGFTIQLVTGYESESMAWFHAPANIRQLQEPELSS